MIRFRIPRLFLASATLSPAVITSAQGRPDGACAELTTLNLPSLRVVAANTVQPAPVWVPPSMARQVHANQVSVTVPFCRVQGVIEQEINFELWLPLPERWNGRFFGTGNGGFAGFLRYEELTRGLLRGFASVSTDTGHTVDELHWSLNRPERVENYRSRAQHLVAQNARKITELYYKRPIKKAYFMGCSGGGMQAMNEVQRYPADYDGIIAGAAGTSIVGISARWLQSALIYQQNPAESPTSEDWRAIAGPAVAACDAADGVKDGVINNPLACHFDIATTPGLPAAKIKHAKELYAPVVDASGAVLFDGFTPDVAYSPLHQPGNAGEMFGEWTYGNRNWNPNSFDAARDVPRAEAELPGLTTRNPNLEAFARRGGKLISYQGWTDPIVPALSTIGYHEQVVSFMGRAQTDSFFRLFLAPGMDHCSGGAGPDSFGNFLYGDPPVVDARHDLLSAAIRWVEDGVAPDEIIASKVEDGQVQQTRPLCAYPKISHYSGRGSSNDVASFTCEAPQKDPRGR